MSISLLAREQFQKLGAIRNLAVSSPKINAFKTPLRVAGLPVNMSDIVGADGT